jgi:hypothetical protein
VVADDCALSEIASHGRLPRRQNLQILTLAGALALSTFRHRTGPDGGPRLARRLGSSLNSGQRVAGPGVSWPSGAQCCWRHHWRKSVTSFSIAKGDQAAKKIGDMKKGEPKKE